MSVLIYLFGPYTKLDYHPDGSYHGSRIPSTNAQITVEATRPQTSAHRLDGVLGTCDLKSKGSAHHLAPLSGCSDPSLSDPELLPGSLQDHSGAVT